MLESKNGRHAFHFSLFLGSMSVILFYCRRLLVFPSKEIKFIVAYLFGTRMVVIDVSQEYIHLHLLNFLIYHLNSSLFILAEINF